MAYITGTITDANAASVFYNEIANALTTAGWTLSDTVVISTRTHKVWKSPAAGNALALDWYMDVAYPTTGAGDITFMPMEYYDPATDLAYRAVSPNTSSAPDATYYSGFGATGYSLESSNWLTNASATTGPRFQTTTTAFGYWVSVTPNRIVGITSNDANRLHYAGYYTLPTAVATNVGSAAFPLIAGVLNQSGNTASSTTTGVARLPKLQGAWDNYFGGWWYNQYFQPVHNNAGDYVMLPGGRTTMWGNPTASPIKISNGNGNYPGVSMYGYTGILPDVLRIMTNLSIVRGDTITIGSDTWVFITAGGSSSVLFKAI